MIKLITLAFRNIGAARKRTVFLSLSLGLTAAIYFLMMNLANSLEARSYEVATLLYTGQVNVVSIHKRKINRAEVMAPQLSQIRSHVQREFPKVVVIERQVASIQLITPKGSQSMFLTGIDPVQDERLAQALGVNSDWKEGLVLFRDQAEKLGIQVGSTVTVRIDPQEGGRNAMDLKVLAVADNRGLMSGLFAFTQRQTVENLAQRKSGTSGLLAIMLPDRFQAGMVRNRLERVLKESGFDLHSNEGSPIWNKTAQLAQEDWVGTRVGVTTWEDELSPLRWISQLIRALTLGFVALLGLLIAFGLSSAIWLLIKQRTREIGTLKAMGFSRWHILGIFMMETQILAVVTGIAAITLGILALLVLNSLNVSIHNQGVQLFLMAETFEVYPHAGVALQTLIITCLVAGLGTFFPAFSASKLQPSVALSR